MDTQTPNLNEVLFKLMEEPSKYSYHLDSNDWLKIYEVDKPEKLLYIQPSREFIYQFFQTIGVQ